MGTIFKTLVLLGCGLGALGAPQGGSVGLGVLSAVMSNMSGLDEEILEAVTDATTATTPTTADSCSAGSETLDKVLSALGDMSEVTRLLTVGMQT